MSTPYYRDGLVTLYHGDCRAVTEWIDADVLVTDPPYGIDYHSRRRRERDGSIVGDLDTGVRDATLAMWGGRPALVFGTWRAPRPVGTHTRLIWDTQGHLGMGDLAVPWKPSDQEIYVLGSGFRGRRDSNVLVCPPVWSTIGRVHPHEKPVALLAALLAKCPPGVVADPFAGSGSLGVAAKMLGRRAVLVEVDERYCEIAARRLAQDSLPFPEEAVS